MRSRSRNANLRPPSQPRLWSETTIRGTNHRPPSPSGPYPWLLFCHHTYYKRRRQTFITLTAGHKTHRRAIPELCNKRVMGCFHGWLILLGKKTSDDHQRHYSLWNASTFETITLPPIKPELKFTVRSCLLSNPPGEPDSMVLLFDYDRPRILFFRINRRDDNSNSKGWTLMQFNQLQFIDMEIWEEDNTDFDDYFAHSASCNGVIYVTTRGYSNLLKLDTDEKDGNKLVLKSLKTSLPDHGKHYSARSRRYLVESEGELFLVRISLGGIMWNEVIAVGVYMLNLSRMDWLKVDRIADRVFFLGVSSFSCPASSESDKNCIYFVEEEDRYLYSYNVASRSLSVVFVFPELLGPKSFPTWFMPPTNEEESLQGEKKEDTSVITERETEDSSKLINLLPLTQDNLVEIARYLSLLDYMNFRIVSRAFLCAAPAIQWRKTSPATHSLSPWLIFIGKEDDRDVFTFIEPDLNERYHTSIPDC